MKLIVVAMIAFLSGVLVTKCFGLHLEEKTKLENLLHKIIMYYNIFNIWMDIKQRRVSIAEYLRDNNYKKVIIYGMKELGERLFVELREEGINIVAVVDYNKNILGDFLLLSPDDSLPNADIIIVTAEYYYSDIEKIMKEKVACPIIKLSELLSKASRCSYR